jgi:hypothetical protein
MANCEAILVLGSERVLVKEPMIVGRPPDLNKCEIELVYVGLLLSESCFIRSDLDRDSDDEIPDT